MDHVALGVWACLIYPGVFRPAFGGQKAKPTAGDEGADAQMLRDMFWSNEVSKTAEKTVNFLSDTAAQMNAVCLALALEPVRICLRVFSHIV